MAHALVYVDFDDVLCQTAHTFLNVVEREFGRRYAFEEIQHFDLERSFDLNPQEYGHLMKLVHAPDTLRAMPPMPGVLDVLNRWARNDIETRVVTGRPPETKDVCHEWLDRYGVPYSKVLFVDKYGRMPADRYGPEVISPEQLTSMGFAMAVEDAPIMIEFIMTRTRIPLAVLDRPWNRSLDLSGYAERVVRCSDWAAVGHAFSERVLCSV